MSKEVSERLRYSFGQECNGLKRISRSIELLAE